MLRFHCLECRGLQKLAIEASRAYHDLLANLEAAYIHHDSAASLTLSVHLGKALKLRDSALAELVNHESTHAEKSAKAWRQSA
jgi:hypothetical protein